MKNIDMQIVKSLIEDELYELSFSDRITLYTTIIWITTDIDFDEEWIANAQKQEKSVERYLFDGIVDFMQENNLNPYELYNYENEDEIIEFIKKG